MKKSTKWTLAIIGIAIVAFMVLAGASYFLLSSPTNNRDNHDPVKKAEMIETALEWARLAPFPQDVKDFKVFTEGNAFTRTFKGSFTASEQSIRSWVKQSIGLRNAKTKVISEGKIRYIIKPGGGANSAEVIIDYSSGRVEFIASWS